MLLHYQAAKDARDFFMTNAAFTNTSLPAWAIGTSHNLTMSLDGSKFLMLSDNGANSCLISRKAFHIDMIDPHPEAIIKRCKDRYVSHGNPIGSGHAVVVPTDPRDTIVGI